MRKHVVLVAACWATIGLLVPNVSLAQSKVEYVHYSDNSCTPGPSRRCVSKEAFQPICRKTSAWYTNVFGLVGVMDRLIGTLERNHGKSAFQDVSVYVSKGGDCMFKFNAVGSVSGTSYNRTYYCPVTIIEDDGLGKSDSFAVKSVSTMGCIN